MPDAVDLYELRQATLDYVVEHIIRPTRLDAYLASGQLPGDVIGGASSMLRRVHTGPDRDRYWLDYNRTQVTVSDPFDPDQRSTEDYWKNRVRLTLKWPAIHRELKT